VRLTLHWAKRDAMNNDAMGEPTKFASAHGTSRAGRDAAQRDGEGREV
jgi:hypothetical protein